MFVNLVSAIWGQTATRRRAFTRRRALPSIALLFGAVAAAACGYSPVTAADSAGDKGPNSEKYLLRHHLMPGQQLRYEVTHLAKTKTRMDKTEEVSSVHTISVRTWQVREASDTKMTFDHRIESVEMTQQNGQKDEVRWKSGSDEAPPAMFQAIADQLGKPLATVTINPRGQEVKRETHGGSKSKLGMGELVLAFPNDPVAIGGSWAIPREIKTRTEQGTIKTIKIRQLYTLQKVQSGVATIKIKSQPITPIDDPAIRSQTVQQLNNGHLRFDLDNGYLLSKQLDWDETVVSFQGPGSMMQYRSRMSEELVNGGNIQSAAAGHSILKR